MNGGPVADQYGAEQRSADRRLLRSLVVGMLVLLVVLLQGIVNGVVLSDELDDLDPGERRSIAGALQAIPGCSNPLSRLVELEPAVDRAPVARAFRYRCSLSILGVPVVTGEAHCGDGRWRVPGYLDMQDGGACGPLAEGSG